MSLNLDALDGRKAKGSRIPVKSQHGNSSKQKVDSQVNPVKSVTPKSVVQSEFANKLKASTWTEYYHYSKLDFGRQRKMPADTDRRSGCTPKKPAHK